MFSTKSKVSGGHVAAKGAPKTGGAARKTMAGGGSNKSGGAS
jgi:hypothetical protein